MIALRARAEVPRDDVTGLPAERVLEHLVQEVERDPGQERGRPDPAGVLEDRLARILPGEFERWYGQGPDAGGQLALGDRELLGVEDHGAAAPEAGRVHIDRLLVEGVQDVETVALGVRPSVPGTRVVPDVPSTDHRLVGVEAEDVEAHPGKASGDCLAHGGDAVPGLTSRTDRKLRHRSIERTSVLIGCALHRR